MNGEELPIWKYQKEIVESIRGEPVLIISGKTGCGKSTQVPQFILNDNPGARIAICEPRRLAATSLAVRVAQERKCTLGREVGYIIGMEARAGPQTNAIFMTYGILIQQLLFSKSIPFTHIILDQVHQRSLEMDFAFIALKKIITQKEGKIKLIIMSATLNSHQFSKYFKTDTKTNKFYIPEISIVEQTVENSEQSHRFRGRRREGVQVGDKPTVRRVKIDANRPAAEFANAKSIVLPDQNKYKVEQVFLDDLNKEVSFDKYGDQIRISDQLYRFAVTLIESYEKSGQGGDILVFVPGMAQIKKLKACIISQLTKIKPERIIEVHSLFSEDLFYQLFTNKVGGKIIIATNMGESSITLPNCKIVIDFCLNRKIFSNRYKGISKFETLLASKANLLQRSGRVGRVSDGKVYRMIDRETYHTLKEFDIPQIHCVSLQMVILRSKQLDVINQCNIFEDPYSMLLSAIEPPKLIEIQTAILTLLKQQALVKQQEKKQSKKQYEQRRIQQNAMNLKMTHIGMFMVSMPCDLKISKMILMGLKLGIPNTIVNIASILMAPKGFFAHEQKRICIQEYMHALIGYDHGNYNDFLLRCRLFEHWRQRYYLPFLENKLKKNHKHTYLKKLSRQQQQIDYKQQYDRNYGEDDRAEQIAKILQDFSANTLQEGEYNFCNSRGVYPNNMRQILKIRQNIILKVEGMGFQFSEEKQNPQNVLVLLCLIYAFPDNQCEISWDGGKSKKTYQQDICVDYVSVPGQTTDEEIDQYCKPERDWKIEKEKDNKKIYGCPSVLSKFLLPCFYKLGNTKHASKIYKYLSTSKPFYPYEAAIFHKRRPIYVQNDSINRVIIKKDPRAKYYLITNAIHQNNDRRMMGACAEIEQTTLHLIQLITRKQVSLGLHISRQFYGTIMVGGQCYDSSCLIGGEELHVIKEMRKLAKRQKHNRVVCAEEMMRAEDVRVLLAFLTNQGRGRGKKECWQALFMQQAGIDTQACQEVFPIDEAPQLTLTSKYTYYQRYYDWKWKTLLSYYQFQRSFSIDKVTIICKACNKQELVQIEFFSTYDPQVKMLRLNEYSGSWKMNKTTRALTCRKDHVIGRAMDEHYAELDPKSLLIYIPFGKVFDFKLEYSQEDLEQLAYQDQKGAKASLQEEKRKVKDFTCKICFDDSGYSQNSSFYLQQRNDPKFWKKVFDHLKHRDHLINLEKFRQKMN